MQIGDKFRRGHTPETRQQILELLASGQETKRSIELKYGIASTTTRRWEKAERSKPSSTNAACKTIEPERLVGLPREEEDKTIPMGKSIVLVCPDLHSPAHHPDALEFLKAVKRHFKPNVYVNLGDEVDFQALSRFPHNPDMPSAGMELSSAIEGLIPFYLEFPEMKVCVSNHTSRGFRTAFGAGLPRAFLNHISTVLNAPDGWKWADEWIIDGTMYFHGDRGKHGQYSHVNYLRAFKMNCVHGHVHAFAGVNWEGNHFAVNSGCLIDPKSPAFDYARGRAPGVSLGCTVVFYGRQAHFIPMITDPVTGRWIGTLR